MSPMNFAPEKLPALTGKQILFVTSSEDDMSIEDEDSDFCFVTDDEEDDSDFKEEDIQDEEDEVEESETDLYGGEQSDVNFDDDEEYDSISENESSEVDDARGCDQKGLKFTDEDISAKVVNLLRQRNKKLDSLKLEECKSYLRKHKLMISGTKETCIQRIIEHWRLKDGNGERLYPLSSFTINCTGDVCKGDVVMFKQRVYEKFHKVSRKKNIIGKRTVAGRIVKESYGSAKQQHTFTVEILWSKGVKPLRALHTLLVKGRNLYKYKTFRQHWGNEAKRSKVLEEKHRRGAAARCIRASARARISTDSCIPTGSNNQKRVYNSRHFVKPLERNQPMFASREKRQKTLAKSISGCKYAASTSSNKQPNKHKSKNIICQSSKFKTIRQAYQSENKVRRLHADSQLPAFPNIYKHHHDHSHVSFNQKMDIAAPEASRERSLIRIYNYQNSGYANHLFPESHDHLMNMRKNIRHAYDPRGNFMHSYTSFSSQPSSSSKNYFTSDLL